MAPSRGSTSETTSSSRTFKATIVDGSRADLVAHLTEQLGAPSRDEDKDTRWTGNEVEVRLAGASVTMNYLPLWSR